MLLVAFACVAAVFASDARAVEQAATAPPAEPSAIEKLNNNVCDVAGMVLRVSKVDKSPWGDAPSQMNTIETHVAVSIEARVPHRKTVEANHPCTATPKGTLRTYKLCSPIRVKQGDRILATEGINTGSARTIGCLFDIKVVSSVPLAKKI
jgi:hypothetical protein